MYHLVIIVTLYSYDHFHHIQLQYYTLENINRLYNFQFYVVLCKNDEYDVFRLCCLKKA